MHHKLQLVQICVWLFSLSFFSLSSSLSVTLAFLLLFCLLSIFFSLTSVDVPLDGLLCLVCMVKVPTTAPMVSPWKPAWSNKPQRNNSPSYLFHGLVSSPAALSFSASTAPLDLKEGFPPPPTPDTLVGSVTEGRLSSFLSWFSWISFSQTHSQAAPAFLRHSFLSVPHSTHLSAPPRPPPPPLFSPASLPPHAFMLLWSAGGKPMPCSVMTPLTNGW